MVFRGDIVLCGCAQPALSEVERGPRIWGPAGAPLPLRLKSQATAPRVVESNLYCVSDLLPIFAWAHFSAIFEIARSAVCCSRVLLLLIAVESISMPVTQGIWSWDKFLHGGQDFELGLLIILTCICFVLLRAQQSDRNSILFAVTSTLVVRSQKQPAAAFFQGTRTFEHRSQIPSPSGPAVFNVPLLV